jgi:MinD-like ATPase involved in chromosome partitioning or flagellar assembly
LTKIVSTHSFRGGTGKSNTTANLAVMVARAGHRVGVIDTDIQSPGIHVIFHVEPTAVSKSLNDYLWGRCKIEEAANDVTETALGEYPTHHVRTKLFLIPSSINTGEIARILREGYDVARLNDGIHELSKALDLDYLFIDTHPGVNEETLLSLAISDVLVLIMRPDHQDFQGTAVTVELARRLEVPQMFVMINKVPSGMDYDALRRKVAQSYNCEVAGILPLNAEIARLASSGIFTNRYPDHPFSLELGRVTEKILQQG